MPFERACGTLLHITSLPSPGEIGDLGEEAYRFVDFLAASHQRLWQVLPINPAGTGNSPYSATSAFAGNPLLISMERLAQRRWVDKDQLSRPAKSNCHVDFADVQARKLPLLREAADRFVDQAEPKRRARFEEYVSRASGLDLEAHLETPANASALAAAPHVKGALRALYEAANGGRIGHLHLAPLGAVPATLAFASDLAGTYRLVAGEVHEVALDAAEAGEEHRFTTLGAFLESALVRAFAEALHRKAEVDAGDDLDEEPWLAAARALELRIDPKMLRTRED